MAKRIRNPVEVKIVLDKGVAEASLHYGLECDDGLEMRKGFTPTLTPAQQAVIDGLVTQAIAAIQAHEGI